MRYLFKVCLISVAVLFVGGCDENELSTDNYGFDESIAILIYQNEIRADNKVDESYAKLELKNFNPDFMLMDEYVIDGVKYTDNGEFNDEFAGDSVYTSIYKVDNSYLVKDASESDVVNFSPNFRFKNELQEELKIKYKSDNYNSTNSQKGEGKITFGCKVRLITCPESGFWDTCWPLSSPCTCVDFYDCEASIELSF